MSEEQYEWPWQHSFPPFFTLQPNAETRARQVAVWRNLVLDFCRTTKQTIVDVREAPRQALFSNDNINRKLDTEFVLAILSDLQRTQNAAPIDKQRNRWEIYWHTLEEWANMIHSYINNSGSTDTVLTLFELTQGDVVQDEEFCGLDTDIFIKALRLLENEGKCELMLFDDQQGVKFF